MRRRFGINKKEMVELNDRIEKSDSMAERLNLETRIGSIEEIEEKMFPWLRQRRRAARRR